MQIKYFDCMYLIILILYLESNKKTKAARCLLSFITDGIQNIKKCSECYLNTIKHPANGFALVCDEPHLIIWVKRIEFNYYWPAKVITTDMQKVGVRFFGDHSLANVSASACFLYSESSPNRISKSSALYAVAIKVIHFFFPCTYMLL